MVRRGAAWGLGVGGHSRNPEQKAPGSTRGLVSALTGPDTQDRPPIAPWCPGTNTHPDLVIRALKRHLSPKWFSNYTLQAVSGWETTANSTLPCSASECYTVDV